jgi:hypothetical protein
MKFSTVLLDPDKFVSLKKQKEGYPRKWEDCTGVKVTDIVGVKKGDDFVITSRETWKRIELFAEILSAVDMSINHEKLNEILGGRS